MINASDLPTVVWAQIWQLTVLIPAVALAVRVLARRRPHLAHVLWLVVLAKCLTPPVWCCPAGIFCWASRVEPHDEPAVVAESERAAPGRLAVRIVEPTSATRDGAKPQTPGMLSGANLPAAVSTAAARRELQPGWSFSQWLLAVWIGGAGVSLALAVSRWLLFLYRLRKSERCAPRLQDCVDRLARALRVRRRVRLLVTAQPHWPRGHRPLAAHDPVA